jgi:hypothetical protein
MVTEGKDRKVDTTDSNTDDGAKRLPHERDETPDAAHPDHLRGVMKQAASDLEQGLVDTDLHGERGIEQATPRTPAAAKPAPDETTRSSPQTRS